MTTSLDVPTGPTRTRPGPRRSMRRGQIPRSLALYPIASSSARGTRTLTIFPHQSTAAGHVPHDGAGALARERDGNGMGTDAVAGGAAGSVGGFEPRTPPIVGAPSSWAVRTTAGRDTAAFVPASAFQSLRWLGLRLQRSIDLRRAAPEVLRAGLSGGDLSESSMRELASDLSLTALVRCALG